MGLEFICSIWILLIFSTLYSTNRRLIYSANIAEPRGMVWTIFYLNFFLHRLPGEHLSLEGGVVNRETIIQTEDKGSSLFLGKHPSCWSVCVQKCRIPATWLSALTRPVRGQTEYMHNDQWRIQSLFNFCYWSQLSSLVILNLSRYTFKLLFSFF